MSWVVWPLNWVVRRSQEYVREGLQDLNPDLPLACVLIPSCRGRLHHTCYTQYTCHIYTPHIHSTYTQTQQAPQDPIDGKETKPQEVLEGMWAVSVFCDRPWIWVMEKRDSLFNPV